VTRTRREADCKGTAYEPERAKGAPCSSFACLAFVSLVRGGKRDAMHYTQVLHWCMPALLHVQLRSACCTSDTVYAAWSGAIKVKRAAHLLLPCGSWKQAAANNNILEGAIKHVKGMRSSAPDFLSLPTAEVP